jgi:hypothetical protein
MTQTKEIPARLLAETLCPEFRVWLAEVGTRCGKTPEQIYGMWWDYCRTCSSYDQSPVQSEFLEWYRAQLLAAPPATLSIGGRVHYSGDMANDSGWFTVTAIHDGFMNCDLAEIDGARRFPRTHVDPTDIYQGHCAPRFVTGEAYDTWRRDCAA